MPVTNQAPNQQKSHYLITWLIKYIPIAMYETNLVLTVDPSQNLTVTKGFSEARPQYLTYQMLCSWTQSQGWPSHQPDSEDMLVPNENTTGGIRESKHKLIALCTTWPGARRNRSLRSRVCRLRTRSDFLSANCSCVPNWRDWLGKKHPQSVINCWNERCSMINICIIVCARFMSWCYRETLPFLCSFYEDWLRCFFFLINFETLKLVL